MFSCLFGVFLDGTGHWPGPQISIRSRGQLEEDLQAALRQLSAELRRSFWALSDCHGDTWPGGAGRGLPSGWVVEVKGSLNGLDFGRGVFGFGGFNFGMDLAWFGWCCVLFLSGHVASSALIGFFLRRENHRFLVEGGKTVNILVPKRDRPFSGLGAKDHTGGWG